MKSAECVSGPAWLQAPGGTPSWSDNGHNIRNTSGPRAPGAAAGDRIDFHTLFTNKSSSVRWLSIFIQNRLQILLSLELWSIGWFAALQWFSNWWMLSKVRHFGFPINCLKTLEQFVGANYLFTPLSSTNWNVSPRIPIYNRKWIPRCRLGHYTSHKLPSLLPQV